MQALRTEQIIENLTILFTVSDVSGDRLQDVLFLSEEEIISILTDSRQNIPEDVANTVQFKKGQPLALVWDQDNGERYWCISFYLGVSHIEDYVIVDYLLQCFIKMEKNNEWFRSTIDDKQHIRNWLFHVL